MALVTKENHAMDDGVYTGQMREHPMAKYKGIFIKHGKGKLVSPGGDVYDGQWEFDAMHGTGVWRFANGNLYDGEFRDGTMEGSGVMEYADGGRYEGQWSDGMRHGEGVQWYADGSRYQGLFAADQRAGYGQLNYASGEKYEGIFANDLQQGEGTHLFLNGDRWQGQWKGGERLKGSYHYASGMRYDEVYEDGVCIKGPSLGHGTVHYPDGSTYTGDWDRGVEGSVTGSKEGRGTLEISQTGDRYEGQFVGDKMHGQGVYYFQAKRSEAGLRVEVRYEGTFYNDRIDGYGTMFYDNGDRHEGFWTDNRAHGLGFSVRADDPYEGAWQADLYAKGRLALGGKYNVHLRGAPAV
eukprot:GGOE01000906.1.p1 GENE.GGOE01000906.1~~GGOE01000906.1.p1  ORF type:complete len:352 (-),score=90.58 GGOE01000906.1:231-1286(-)